MKTPIALLALFVSTSILPMQAPLFIEKKVPMRPARANDTLLLAIERDDQQMVTSFLDSGLDINATYQEPFEVEEFNSVTGIKINKTKYKLDTFGNTALMHAVRFGKLAIVKQLLSAGADPNKQNLQKHTALTLATDITIMKALLEGNANPNIPTFWGYTALIYSIMKRNEPQIGLLLQYGADPNIRTIYGFNAFDHAGEAGLISSCMVAQARQNYLDKAQAKSKQN